MRWGTPEAVPIELNDSYISTRRQLRGVAESLIAGPQYRASGTIRLAVRPAGFVGVALPIEVRGGELLWADGRAPLTGQASALADVAGVVAGPPEGAYDITDPLDLDQELAIDLAAADDLCRSLYAGAQALIDFASDQHPVLWPEHFDVAVTVDEVNYGVSPGDSYHERPYAYVGPWSPRTGEFWNAPFGAVLGLDLATAEAELVATITNFFAKGHAAL